MIDVDAYGINGLSLASGGKYVHCLPTSLSDLLIKGLCKSEISKRLNINQDG